MPEEQNPVNGADAPGRGRQIVITFHPDGTPAVQVMGGVTPTNLESAAFWLNRVATLQLDQGIMAQLQAQGPRLVVPR